jgi:hypothetical protein
MKKLLFFIPVTVAVMMYSSLSHADRDHGWNGGYGRGWGGGHGHGWGHHHHHHQHYYPRPQINYYPAPQINYYPAPPVNYYPQPQANYYSPQPRYDQRSHQGLAGGVIGSVFGYEIGNGDPVAAGLGAAAGSFLGNGAGGRW